MLGIKIMQRIINDMSVSAVVAGFVAVLIGFASSVAIVFQAAQAAGADANTIVSWIMALCLGMGATCFFFHYGIKHPLLPHGRPPVLHCL